MKQLIKNIQKISLRKAGWITIVVGGIGILLQLLVRCRIVPYQWVNGGRTGSWEEAKGIVTYSIVMLLILRLISAIGASIIPIKWNKPLHVIFKFVLVALAIYSVIGMVMQCLGTTFEKTFCTVLTLVGSIADIRIAMGQFEKNSYIENESKNNNETIVTKRIV